MAASKPRTRTQLVMVSTAYCRCWQHFQSRNDWEHDWYGWLFSPYGRAFLGYTAVDELAWPKLRVLG